MSYIIVVLFFILAYLLGSIPTALVVVKAITGKDLRQIGSGNIGGTNASRAADTKTQKYLIYGITAVVDILKGLLPVLIVTLVFKNRDTAFDKNLIYIITAMLAVLGHDTMPFIKGQGKGVATTFGALVLIAPVPAFAGFITFFALRLITPVASRRSIISAVVIAVIAVIIKSPLPITVGTFVSVVLVVITHRENIKRILRGEE